MAAETLPKLWQVFINFRGEELRNSFISHLEGALHLAEINYYIDTKEVPSEDLSVLFTRIEQSEIALLIFSTMYAESEWCLDELVKIVEEEKKGKLRIIPVFFNVKPDEVREQKGEFAVKLYGEGKSKRPNIPVWENALQSVPSKIGLDFANYRNEKELIDKIVVSVKIVLSKIISETSNGISSSGTKQCLEVKKEPESENVDTFSFQNQCLEVKKEPESESENVDTFSLQNQPKGEKLRTSAVSSTEDDPAKYQVFINFRGLRKTYAGYLNFVELLVNAMRSGNIDVFTDESELRGTDLQNLLTRIEKSRVAVAVFSEKYTESSWCLDELVKMKELMEQGKLEVITVFYRLDPSNCRNLEGTFGDNFRKLEKEYRSEPGRIQKWKEALAYVSYKLGFKLSLRRNESNAIDSIVEYVNISNWKNALQSVPSKIGIDFANFRTEKELIDKIVVSVERVFAKIKFESTNGMIQRLEVKKDSGSESVDTFSFQNQQKLRSLAVSSTEEDPAQYQVFINFRGYELRKTYAGYINFAELLVNAMRSGNIDVFTDGPELRGTDLQNLFKRIEKSRVAVVVFSEKYTESSWCLDELVKMKEQMDKGKLVVITVFYRLDPTNCKNLEGTFGDNFRKLVKEYRSEPGRIQKWKEALASVSNKLGFKLSLRSRNEGNVCFFDSIVEYVNILDWKNALQSVPSKIGLDFANFRNEEELIDKIVVLVKRMLANIKSESTSGMKQINENGKS